MKKPILGYLLNSVHEPLQFPLVLTLFGLDHVIRKFVFITTDIVSGLSCFPLKSGGVVNAADSGVRALAQHSTPSKSIQDYQINHSFFSFNFKQMVNIGSPASTPDRQNRARI
jgi:hypothetical protein